MANRSDNFTRADSTTTMNPPSDGGSNWTAPGGTTWGINTNQGFLAVSAAQAIIVLESSLSNVDVQCTFAVVGTDGGLVAREADDSNYLVLKVATNALTLFKKVGGGFTQIGDAGAITISNGDVIKLRCDSANLLTAFQNGVSKFSVTDAAGSGNTSHGIRDNNDTVNRFKAFSITDNTPVSSNQVALSNYHPGRSPGRGGISSARFQPSNWWPYPSSTAITTTLAPTEGAITIAGVAASITLILAVASGAIMISGNAPSISTVLQGVQGSIVISGNAASTTSILAPTVGSIVISGSAPALTRVLVGVAGAITIGGNQPSTTSILAATEGAVIIGGNAASIVVGSVLSPTEGAIAISGNAPDLLSALTALDGAITIIGNAPNIVGAGSVVEQASNWQSGHQWKSRTKKELKEEEDRKRIELGILPPELEAVAEKAVAEAVAASTELAAGRVDPENAIGVAMQAREEYDSAYKQAYKDAYIAEVVAELWKEDVKRAQRRRAVALLLLH